MPENDENYKYTLFLGGFEVMGDFKIYKVLSTKIFIDVPDENERGKRWFPFYNARATV